MATPEAASRASPETTPGAIQAGVPGTQATTPATTVAAAHASAPGTTLATTARSHLVMKYRAFFTGLVPPNRIGDDKLPTKKVKVCIFSVIEC